MKVTLKEIRRLQEDISDEIELISDDPDSDYDRLTVLRTVNFNISMLFLRYSMEKDNTVIELDDEADMQIIEELRPHRKNVGSKKGSTDAFISQITPLLQNLLNDIDDLRSTLPSGSRNYLSRNIDAQLLLAKEPVEKIISLGDDEETLSVWKKALIPSVTAAASAMGKTRTEKKAAAARENGRKGGRPKKEEPEKKKSPVTKSTAKKSPAKSTASGSKKTAGNAKKTAGKKTASPAKKTSKSASKKI